jgi:hypothetical protein
MFAHIISFLRIQDTSTIMKLSVAILSLCLLGNALHCDASRLRALRKLEETAPSVDTNTVETMETMETMPSGDSSPDSEDLRKLEETAPSVDTNTVETMETMETMPSGDSSPDSEDSSPSSEDGQDGDLQLLASALESSGSLSTSRGSFVVAGLGVAAAICAF